jgi:hypothetical protein
MVFITRGLPQEAIEAALTVFEKAVEEPPEPPSSADKPPGVPRCRSVGRATAEPLQGSTGVIGGNCRFRD